MAIFDHSCRLEQVIVAPSLLIVKAIAQLDRSGLGVLLLCDEERRLTGILTDGDIRRAILKGIPIEEPCYTIASQDPLVGKSGITPRMALHLMDHGKPFLVDHLPIVDEQGRLMDLLIRRDLTTEEQIDLSAVIMAGGYGVRLQPLTSDTPKPMLPVGDRPLMELLVHQLRQSGIRRINVTTHYLSEKISEYFGDGNRFGVELNYVSEEQPLGTAGALGLMGCPQEPLLVINGDILTRVDFRAMFAFHRKHNAEMTVGVRQYSLTVPYGVLECEGSYLQCVHEKPTYNFLVNAGIYLLEPTVYDLINSGERLDMTDLIERLLVAARTVVSFPIVEYWLDIGQHEDYEQAQKDIDSGRFSLELVE